MSLCLVVQPTLKVDAESYKSNFESAKEKLEALDYQTIQPDPEKILELDSTDALLMTLRTMHESSCKAIYLCGNWDKDTNCMIVRLCAKYLKISSLS